MTRMIRYLYDLPRPISMSILILLFIICIQWSLNVCDIVSINNISHCSLLFQIKTFYPSNTIGTNFPIDFMANYNLTCDDIKNFTGYFKITPLSILTLDKYTKKSNDLKSMLELHVKNFNFSLNQSSTVQLCVLLMNNHDFYEHLLCRQIHVGINSLFSFWNLSMQLLYMCLICFISIYYVVCSRLHQWRQNENKLVLKTSKCNPDV